MPLEFSAIEFEYCESLELLELIRKAGDEKDKTAMVSINWPQAVIRVQYTDMQVQESVTIEEANEGEK